MKKKYFLLVECGSTAINYICDIKRRGYTPIILHTTVLPELEKYHKISLSLYPKDVKVVRELTTYEDTVKMLKQYHFVAGAIGGEAAIDIAMRLFRDLSLPTNPYEYIGCYTLKDAMQDALKKAGIRYIRGQKVKNSKEAIAAYRAFNSPQVVLKPPRGGGAQSTYFCCNEKEVKQRADEFFSGKNLFGDKNKVLLIEERIIGEEYVVNCSSRNGTHRVLSIWKYQLIQTKEGRYVFGNIESVNELEIGATDLINYTYKMLDALHWQNGASHNEFLIDEKGPVLVELNARVMGGPIWDHFMDPIFGHHDTDQIVEDLLYPNDFDRKALLPYKTMKKGYCKLIVVPHDIDVKSLPIINIAKRLRSFHDISYSSSDRPNLIKTVDYATIGGIIYLLHDDHNIAREDNDFLHMMETLYFDLLFEGKKKEKKVAKAKTQHTVLAQNIVKHCSKQGTTLVLNDDDKIDCPDTIITDINHVEKQLNMFQYGVINLTKEHRDIPRDVYIDKILTFMSKIRNGGTILISEETTNIFPYGTKGMELLLKVAGFKLDISPMYLKFMTAIKQ